MRLEENNLWEVPGFLRDIHESILLLRPRTLRGKAGAVRQDQVWCNCVVRAGYSLLWLVTNDAFYYTVTPSLKKLGNDDIDRPVLKHGPRSLTYARV